MTYISILLKITEPEDSVVAGSVPALNTAFACPATPSAFVSAVLHAVNFPEVFSVTPLTPAKAVH